MDHSTVNDYDRAPLVLRGEGANLDSFRQSSTDSSFASVLEENRVTPEEGCLCPVATVQATWQTEESTVFSQDHGKFCVTTERILFVSTSDKNNDVSVDAECIQLHAVSDDAIYVQIQETQDSTTPIDFTVTPLDTRVPAQASSMESETAPQQQQQLLFDALTKLVSMHPIPLDDEDDGNEHGGLMDDAIFAPPAVDQGAASDREREAMLDRLDDMLVVPPEFQVRQDRERPSVEGQFEDAPEDEQEQVDAQFEDADDEEDDEIL